MTQTRYEAVVFDNDGVLTVPSDGDLLDRAVATAFAAFGVDADATQVEAV
jgi:beta-phosphoglucomutase-like phosphatase (HAD superfamily)